VAPSAQSDKEGIKSLSFNPDLEKGPSNLGHREDRAPTLRKQEATRFVGAEMNSVRPSQLNHEYDTDEHESKDCRGANGGQSPNLHRCIDVVALPFSFSGIGVNACSLWLPTARCSH
jgi:hypothetical protein